MFENDIKGSFGSYSYAGRSSAQKYHMIVNKDKIINNKTAKKAEEEYYLNEEDENLNYKERIDIFDAKQIQMSKKEKMLKDKLREKKNKFSSLPKDSRFTSNTSNTFSSNLLYNPKIDYIMKKTVTGPKWSTLKGRDKLKNKTRNSKIDLNDTNKKSRENNIPIDYNTTNYSNFSSGKTLVSMDKQTQRGQLISTRDVRIRNEKPFSPIKASLGSKRELKTHKSEDYLNGASNNTQYDLTSNNKTHINSFGNKATLSERRISDQSNTNRTKSNINKSCKTFSEYFASTTENANNSTSNSNITPHINTNSIKAIDFSKTISRQQLNHINRNRNPVTCSFSPNYSVVRERAISMVTYDLSIHPKKKKKALRELTTEPIIIHDVYKLLNNINNYSASPVPNFGIMTSRPNDNKALPSFMQKAYDRSSLNSINAQALLMNNFSNGSLNRNEDTIGQKKSFNSMININLLNSDHSLKILKTEVLSKEEKEFKKRMTYYRRNLDDCAAGTFSNRFDRITLKSIPVKHKIDKKEEKKFVVKFNE